ncbi:MAG TPA: cupin domain-containing protein [Chloroflexota bacterium]
MSFYNLEDLEPGVPRSGADRHLAYESGVLFLNIVFEPGFEMAPHNHAWPALYYVTGGTGIAMVGEEQKELRAGVLAMIPADTMHGIQATTRLSLIEVQANCPQEFVNGILGR